MGLPSPDDHRPTMSSTKKSPSSGNKSVKPQHRAPKRAGSAASVHHHDHITANAGMDGRHKRVWKACERCRMKKTKCDGEFPCKRCKDDGLVCTAGIRKKVEFKQLPRGYAEVLENTQFALIATVHKLYNMVRTGEQWTLGEPELNDRGLPVIHDIASKLGAIRPNSDIDLPVHSVFPEDEAGMAELARQLEEQQGAGAPSLMSRKDSDSTTSSSMSPEMDHSDDGELDTNYRRMAFGNVNTSMSSPASLTHSADFNDTPTSDIDVNNFNLFATQPTTGNFTPPVWPEMVSQQTADSNTGMYSDRAAQLQGLQQQQQEQLRQLLAYNRAQQMMQQQAGANVNLNSFGLKPQALSNMNSDPMISMGDPMIYHGFDYEI